MKKILFVVPLFLSACTAINITETLSVSCQAYFKHIDFNLQNSALPSSQLHELKQKFREHKKSLSRLPINKQEQLCAARLQRLNEKKIKF